MIFYVLLGIAALLGISIFISELRYEGFWAALGLSIITTIISGLIAMLITTLLVGVFLPGNHTTKHEQPLAALGNHTLMSGTFFLGSGSVDGDSYLTYILKGSDGSYQIKTDEADGYKIFQDSASGGTLVTYDSYFEAWWAAPYAMSRYSDLPDELHIPEGSIQTGYNIDVDN